MATPQARRQLRVGLTGGMGCGKSTIVKHLRSLGCPCSDDDAIVHALYSPGGPAVEPLRRHFPSAVESSGGISRPELSRLIQASERPSETLKIIEGIVHPLVGEIKRDFLEIEAAGSWIVIFDIPLLLEGLRARGITSGPGDFDAIIIVACPLEEQRRRCLARPGMTAEKLDLILTRQVKHEERLSHADFLIDTGSKDFDETTSLFVARAQASEVISKLAARHGGPLKLPGPASVLSAARPAVACITFDLDDTLYRMLPSLKRAFHACWAAFQAASPIAYARYTSAARESGSVSTLSLEAEPLQNISKNYQKAVQALKEAKPLLAPNLSELRRLILMSWAQEAGDADPAGAAAAAMKAFLQERGRVEEELFEDALPVLQALRRRGLRLGSITNGNAELASYAPHLRAALDFEISPETAGAAKPSVTLFLAAAHAAGVPDLRMMAHVGDSVETDVRGALAAGVKAVLLQRPPDGAGASDERLGNSIKAEADAVIASLWELEALLDKWDAGPRASSL